MKISRIILVALSAMIITAFVIAVQADERTRTQPLIRWDFKCTAIGNTLCIVEISLINTAGRDLKNVGVEMVVDGREYTSLDTISKIRPNEEKHLQVVISDRHNFGDFRGIMRVYESSRLIDEGEFITVCEQKIPEEEIRYLEE